MSAMLASGVGQGVPPILPPTSRPGRKRGTATPKTVTDAVSGDSPVPSRVSQRVRNAAALSASGDAINKMLIGEDDVAGKPTKHKKNAVPPLHQGSPLKYKSTKHREARIAIRRRSNSVLDLTSHFFSRIFLVFVIGTGLWSSLSAWRTRPQPFDSGNGITAEIGKLEEFVAKTTKWLQVQLEAVDMKMGQEIGALKKDLHKELDAQQMHIATDVKNLKEQVLKVGIFVDALFSQGGPLKKRESLELIKEVVEKRAAEGKGKAFSLDDVRTAARQVVLRELERHSADGIGRVDYALGSGGGRVIAHSEGYYIGSGADWRSFLGLLPGSDRIHAFAEKILQPSFGEPGQCLPLKGSDVWVDIALRTTICPDGVTLEHVSKENAFDISSAPQEFRVFGWHESPGHRDVQNPVTLRQLGEFKYDIAKASVQSFPLANESVAGALINMIRLHVLSNHGSATHTCIYRVRVHGSDPALIRTPSIS